MEEVAPADEAVRDVWVGRAEGGVPRLGKVALDGVQMVAKPRAADGGEVDVAASPAVEAGMHLGLGSGGVRVELHAVGFHTGEGGGVGCEENVGDLGQHRVGEVLDHQLHAVGPGPAKAEEGAGLGFAGFEGDAVPAEFSAEAHELPVVGALV